MADQIDHYVTTIPAGTTKDAPYVDDIDVADLVVTAISLIVPKGPSLQMGFAIYRSGQQVIPYQQGSWFVWDDHSDTFALDHYPSAGGWQIYGYNGGVYDHAVYSTWLLDAIPDIAPPVPAPAIAFMGSRG